MKLSLFGFVSDEVKAQVPLQTFVNVKNETFTYEVKPIKVCE